MCVFPGFYEATRNLGSLPPERNRPRRSLSSPLVSFVVQHSRVRRAAAEDHPRSLKRAARRTIFRSVTLRRGPAPDPPPAAGGARGGESTPDVALDAVAAIVRVLGETARRAPDAAACLEAWARHIHGFRPVGDAVDAPRSIQAVERVVRSTRFIAASPRMVKRGTPRFTG